MCGSRLLPDMGLVLCRICGQAQAATEAEIRNLLRDRVDVRRQATGMVVRIIGSNGRRIVACGTMGRNDDRAVDGHTLFEIGSLTKLFTSLLLADAVVRGEVAPSDPVAKYLPSAVRMPWGGGRAITLVDLATHTSGLPRVPGNMHPADGSNPYADYSAEQLYQFLASYEVTRAVGSQYEYSNLGAGLLGLALARRAGMPYEELLEVRICRPLNMRETAITLTGELKARLAAGHDALLAPMPPWDFDALAGAGAIRSSANDLVTLLSLWVRRPDSRLAAGAAMMLAIRRPTGAPDVEVALGWHVMTRARQQVVGHDGGTFGYSSFLGFNPTTRLGVVVLSNAFTLGACDDIAAQLLTPQRLPSPPTGR